MIARGIHEKKTGVYRSGEGDSNIDRTIWALIIAVVVLPLVTDAKFRARSASASLLGSVDLQIVAELALWASGVFMVGVVIWPKLLHFRISKVSALRYGAALAAMILLGTVLALPNTVAVIRGVQTLSVLVILLAVAPLSIGAVKSMLLRTSWILNWVSLAFLSITLLLPGFSIWTEFSYFGTRRFRLLAMHPIATANLLTLIVVLGVWVLVSTDDHQRIVSNRLTAAAAMMAGFGLLLTRSRGAIFGATVAVTIITLMAAKESSGIRMRRKVRIGGLALGSAALFSSGAIFRYLLRGERVDSLLTLNSRTDLLGAIVVIWRESIWFGFGHLSGRSALLERFSWAGESHNLFGEALLSYGLIGVAVLGVGLIGALIRAQRLRIRRSPFYSLFLALFVILGTQGLVGDGFLGAPGLGLTTFVLLILIGWQRPLVSEKLSRGLPSRPPEQV